MKFSYERFTINCILPPLYCVLIALLHRQELFRVDPWRDGHLGRIPVHLLSLLEPIDFHHKVLPVAQGIRQQIGGCPKKERGKLPNLVPRKGPLIEAVQQPAAPLQPQLAHSVQNEGVVQPRVLPVDLCRLGLVIVNDVHEGRLSKALVQVVVKVNDLTVVGAQANHDVYWESLKGFQGIFEFLVGFHGHGFSVLVLYGFAASRGTIGANHDGNLGTIGTQPWQHANDILPGLQDRLVEGSLSLGLVAGHKLLGAVLIQIAPVPPKDGRHRGHRGQLEIVVLLVRVRLILPSKDTGKGWHRWQHIVVGVANPEFLRPAVRGRIQQSKVCGRLENRKQLCMAHYGFSKFGPTAGVSIGRAIGNTGPSDKNFFLLIVLALFAIVFWQDLVPIHHLHRATIVDDPDPFVRNLRNVVKKCIPQPKREAQTSQPFVVRVV
mmetsp:Transcript_5179/g.10723  ORF Transcript_5179/g.10723 Transcript_5179/m.10723 type:complete len:435 (-) Transcript_5179:269-1573(-)